MEFWLTFNNRAECLQLPVPPSEYTIQNGTTINTVNINAFGEIALIGKTKLGSIELSSFFPNQGYSFCQYTNFPEPYECVKLIEKWRNSGRPIRLIITDTDIDLACCIEEFGYGERDASGDVYFTLALKEYRFPEATKTGVTTPSTATRTVEKKKTGSYTVKSGDSLWLISKRVYGDGSRYLEIAEKNSIKDPAKISVGQVLSV
jgi:hypothetical protein